MTEKAKRLLLKIGGTEEAAIKLTRGMSKAADELKRLGFAIYISHSQGGADVCLTSAGMDEHNRMTEGY